MSTHLYMCLVYFILYEFVGATILDNSVNLEDMKITYETQLTKIIETFHTFEAKVTERVRGLEETVKSQNEKIFQLEREISRKDIVNKITTDVFERLNLQNDKIVSRENKELDLNVPHPLKEITYNQSIDFVERLTSSDMDNNRRNGPHSSEMMGNEAWKNAVNKTNSWEVVQRKLDIDQLKKPLRRADSDITSDPFYAYMRDDMMEPSEHHVFVYDIVTSNPGHNYNRYNGMYTVKETGYYYMSATTIVEGNGVIFFEIVKNGAVFATGLSNSAGIDNSHTGTVSGIVFANPNDVIFVRSQGATNVGSSTGKIKSSNWARTSFCGWRLQ